MGEEAFRRYIAEFNAANFDDLARYYADDVSFSFNGGLILHGRDAIAAFYRPFRQAVDQTADIRFLVMNDEHVAVEMAIEFRVREDYENPCAARCGQATRFASPASSTTTSAPTAASPPSASAATATPEGYLFVLPRMTSM